MSDFGWALSRLRTGSRVTRAGWNGKGMFIVFQKGYPDGIPINQNTAEATGIPQGTVCKFLPYLMMKTVAGDFVPWLASQTDILADDWQIFDGTLPLPKHPFDIDVVYLTKDTKLPVDGITAINFEPAPVPVDSSLLIKGWEVIGLPRRIGGVMAVEVREKK